ncbi:MAG: hypothetical protein NVSMB64_16910 [Candidatus Velthaea sp.]
MRAGLARLAGRPYAPFPTVYDGLFPEGTRLTAPTRAQRVPGPSVDNATAMDEPLTPQAAAAICEHMNEDHGDSILAYARSFAKVAGARGARMTGIDRSGMDIDVVTDAGIRSVRVPFDRELRDVADARQTLVAMSKAAAQA